MLQCGGFGLVIMCIAYVYVYERYAMLWDCDRFERAHLGGFYDRVLGPIEGWNLRPIVLRLTHLNLNPEFRTRDDDDTVTRHKKTRTRCGTSFTKNDRPATTQK